VRSNHHLTRFVAERVAGSRANSLCFGDALSQRTGRNGRISHYFRPGQLFAVVWRRQYANDREHRTFAVLESLPASKNGQILPGIHPGVAIHALVRQHGPAGQDEAVDRLLDLIEELKYRGRNPAEMSAAFWTEATQRLLLSDEPLESFGIESLACLA
jgi:hypothetical protein